MKTLFTIIIILATLGANAQTPPDFRNLNWKMSQQQVKLKEKGLVLKETTKNELVYAGTILNLPAHILYEFTNNELSSAFLNSIRWLL